MQSHIIESGISHRIPLVSDNLVDHRHRLHRRGDRQSPPVKVGKNIALSVHTTIVIIRYIPIIKSITFIIDDSPCHILRRHIVMVAHDEQIVERGCGTVNLFHRRLDTLGCPVPPQPGMHAEAQCTLPVGQTSHGLLELRGREYQIVLACGARIPRAPKHLISGRPDIPVERRIV